MQKVTQNCDLMFLTGERLRKCREICGLSRAQLIEKIENLKDNHGKIRSEKHLSYLENGTRALSVEYAELLAQALNVRSEYLLLKDDFRTETDRIAASVGMRHSRNDLIVEILRCHGYGVEDATQSMPTQVDEQGREFRVAMVSLISPRGATRLFTNEGFLKFISQIDDSIEMQSAFQFRKLRDGASNIYDWEV